VVDKKLVQFTHKDVNLKPIKNLYKGFFQVDLYQFEHALFAGGKSELISREILERGDAIAVLPYDPISDTVLLIEQIRIGAIKSKHSPWLLECIAGMTLETEGEDIKTHILSVDDALMRLNNGEMDNAATVICMQWLALNREKMASKWA